MSIQFSKLLNIIWKKAGLTPVIGVLLIVAGYYISVDLDEKRNVLQNSGVVTRAVILSRNHTYVFNDDDEYKKIHF